MDCRKRIRTLLDSSKSDAVLLVNGKQSSSNFTYMTGFRGGLFEGSMLLICSGGITLYTSMLEYETAIEEAQGCLDVVAVRNPKELDRTLKKRIGEKTIGIDGGALTLEGYKKLRERFSPKRIVDVAPFFADMRRIKDRDETLKIRHAAGITKNALEDIKDYFKDGITEKRLAARFDFLMMDAGADEPSFKSIVCFGANSALPHHAPDNTTLKPNSLVLIDVGARYDNYCADMTRTVIFKGDRYTKKYRRMQDMYDTVSEAQRLAREAARPGAFMDDTHFAAENYINSHNGGAYRGRFIHSLGHSIGIEVHDDNGIGLSPKIHKRIERGMIFSNEPGIYISGFGGVRIEDDMLITDNGAVFL